MQAESGKSAVRRQVAVFFDQRAVVEIRLGQPDLLLVAAGEFIERHRLAVEIAGMEKHRPERQVVGGPQRLVRIETDVAILVVGQIAHPGGQASLVRGDVGFVGEIPRPALDAVKADVLALPSLAQCGGAENDRSRIG